MTVRFAIREQITGVAGRSTTAWPQARSASPPGPGAPSDTHTPNSVTAPLERLVTRHTAPTTDRPADKQQARRVARRLVTGPCNCRRSAAADGRRAAVHLADDFRVLLVALEDDPAPIRRLISRLMRNLLMPSPS
ncbi:hypothetical protein ACVW19_006375 [Streptomyces sp. TE5632]